MMVSASNPTSAPAAENPKGFKAHIRYKIDGANVKVKIGEVIQEAKWKYFPQNGQFFTAEDVKRMVDLAKTYLANHNITCDTVFFTHKGKTDQVTFGRKEHGKEHVRIAISEAAVKSGEAVGALIEFYKSKNREGLTVFAK